MFFERMMLSHETIELVVEAQRRGINVSRILREILYPEGCNKASWLPGLQAYRLNSLPASASL